MNKPTRKSTRIMAMLLMLVMVASTFCGAFAPTAYALNGYGIKMVRSENVFGGTMSYFPLYSIAAAPQGSKLAVGQPVFCIDRDTNHAEDIVTLHDADDLTYSEFWNSLSRDKQRGVTYTTLYANMNDEYDRIAAQILVWEFTNGHWEMGSIPSHHIGSVFQGYDEAMRVMGYTANADKLKNAYMALVEKVVNHDVLRSFNASEVSLTPAKGKYTATITDTNSISVVSPSKGFLDGDSFVALWWIFKKANSGIIYNSKQQGFLI